MRRVLVLGASGQLGSELAMQLQEVDQLTVYAASRGDRRYPFDLRTPASLAELVAKTRPTDVLHAAAGGSVAWCEAHPEESWVSTVEAAATVAHACRELGAKLVFFSTDYVFDGRSERPSETVVPAPLNVYGRHKLAAEAAVLASSSSNLVVRTSQLFGRDTKRRNFVYQVVDAVRGGKGFQANAQLFGTPTWTSDLARITLDLVSVDETGTWHAAGESYLSRYELAMLTCEVFALDAGQVRPLPPGSATDGVERPKRAGLTNHRLHELGRATMTPLATALRRVRDEELAGV